MFYHNKIWCAGAIKTHVDPPPNMLIKSNNELKAEKDCVKIKFHIYIVHKKIKTNMNFKNPCLTTASQRSSYCSCVISR